VTRSPALNLLLGGEQSPAQKRAADLMLELARQRDYRAWLEGLPIPAGDRELVRILDRLRRQLLDGGGAPPTVAKALAVFGRGLLKHEKIMRVGLYVDSAYADWVDLDRDDWRPRRNAVPHRLLPKAENSRSGMNAFEYAGRKMNPPLSVSQVKKLYREYRNLKQKGPRNSKARTQER
jgi:hypothetical protein